MEKKIAENIKLMFVTFYSEGIWSSSNPLNRNKTK